MKRFMLAVVVIFFATGWAVHAQTQKRRAQAAQENGGAKITTKDATGFMRLKLEHSQKLLEAVALEDFASIRQHAQKLGSLALDENWQMLQTREYREYSSEFQQIASRISKAADEKNLDAAALGYVQLTLNCVDCHKHVRDEGNDRR